MPASCCAFGCTNSNAKSSCKENGISFHYFPHSNPKLMREWIARIKRLDFTPTTYTRICSAHFEDDCFVYQNFTNRRQLKPSAVPTKFIFNVVRKKRKRTSYTVSAPSQIQDGCSDSSSFDGSKRKQTSHTVAAPSQIQDGCSDSADQVEPLPHNSAATSTSSQTEISFESLIENLSSHQEEILSLRASLEETKFSPNNVKLKSHMKCLTNFTHERFISIFNFLDIQNLSQNNYCSSLSSADQFFLFMIKIRTGITNEFLGILFKISSSTVSRIFNKVTEEIYSKIIHINIWPSKDQIKEYMPFEFIQNYPNCRIIIDCTELHIQKPFNPKEQQATFSYYKNANTLKALIGISPSGGLSFISDLWCGSISDKALFMKSGLLHLLEPNDVVLADRGFTISKELEKKQCKLMMPHFLKDKIQFSMNEKIENRKVSHLRVHVERAISRIKTFRYFEGSLPYRSLHNANEVFYICAFLTNFNDPLINVIALPERHTCSSQNSTFD